VSNLFKRETLSGEFMQINTYLVRDLQSRGLWDDDMRDAVKKAEGSVQDIPRFPTTSSCCSARRGSCPMRSLIDMAADRGAFIDQSQSLNLFVESPTIGKLSSMYLHAWKQGLEDQPTTCAPDRRRASRRRPPPTSRHPPSASVTPIVAPAPETTFTDEEALACSIENPDACEACQVSERSERTFSRSFRREAPRCSSAHRRRRSPDECS